MTTPSPMPHPTDLDTYETIAEAIRFLDEHVGDDSAEGHPSLEEVAARVGLSPWHFQRLFTRWAGLSPKRYLQALTAETAKKALRDAPSVLDATWETGLSSPGRLHDLLVTLEAVTPGEVRREGSGLEIRWGLHPSPFGPCLLAMTERGICSLRFLDADDGADEALGELVASWPRARLVEDEATTGREVERIFSRCGERPTDPLPLLVRGTNFQVRVWEALLRVPAGRATTYGRLAEAIGSEGASRAVGGAVGRNPVAVLIPCHRVLRADGRWGGYRWGVEKKRRLMAWESAARSGGDDSRAPLATASAG